MSRTIYALFVGIDQYESPVPPLRGCVNDIRRVRDLLLNRAASAGEIFKPVELLDRAATRQNVIDSFKTHLGQAQKEDVALFYYSGHGSQAQSAPEFWSIEPDRLDETLVCHNSRKPGQWDLADKELARLINDVSHGGAHVVVILDCCHSGSGSRNTTPSAWQTRRAPTDHRQRPIESYLVSPAEANDYEQSSGGTRSLQTASGWLTLPSGRHIVLSACRSDEEAKELVLGGEQRGAFSYYLLDTLQQAQGSLSYRDLFKRLDALVRSAVPKQEPQIDATQSSDLDQPFLGCLSLVVRTSFSVSQDKRRGWVIDGGAVHGITAPSGGESTLLALFPFDADGETLHDLKAAVGEVQVQKVFPAQSTVTITLKDGAQPNPKTTYKAVITALPLPKLAVNLAGNKKAIDLLREALQTSAIDQQPSLLVREAALKEASYRVTAERVEGQPLYRIRRIGDLWPFALDTPEFSAESAKLAVHRLEHIARWSLAASLSNATTRIAANAVTLEVLGVDEDGNEALLDPAGGIRLAYQEVGTEWRAQRFKVRLTNTSKQTLHCALFYIGNDFSITSALAAGSEKLAAGQVTFASVRGDDIFDAAIADAEWSAGISEVSDTIKLIVSNEPFDGRSLELEALPLTFAPTTQKDVFAIHSTLDRLLERVNSRLLRPSGEGNEVIADWRSSEVRITTVRPNGAVPIAPAGRSVELGAGVTLLGHATFTAQARLTSSEAISRDVGNLQLPALLRDRPALSQPLSFGGTRSGAAGLTVLELFAVNDHNLVTRHDPLLVQVPLVLAAGESVLPIGFDGEFFLPLGYAQATADGLAIRLERLPAPTQQGTRSVTGSIKILFQKFAAQYLKLEFAYPQLAISSLGPDGQVRYNADSHEVKQEVVKAKRILLYIHGILGDTQTMVASSRPTMLNIPALTDHYDLLLAFDYENINTTIQDNARALKQRLETVGLGAGHNKTLHIVAHSMGGLITRWLVEREGGKAMVQRVVLVGTPNNGSPWSKVEEWALTTLAAVLNGFAGVSWPVSTLTGLLTLLETIDVSLDQLQPGSDLLQDLAASGDPGVPYAIVAGNLALLETTKVGEEEKNGLMQRLWQRVTQQNWGHQAAGLLFVGQPNDLAVSVESMKGIADSRNPAPVKQTVACDHMSYFVTEAGLRGVVEALDVQ